MKIDTCETDTFFHLSDMVDAIRSYFRLSIRYTSEFQLHIPNVDLSNNRYFLNFARFLNSFLVYVELAVEVEKYEPSLYEYLYRVFYIFFGKTLKAYYGHKLNEMKSLNYPEDNELVHEIVTLINDRLYSHLPSYRDT